MSVEWPLQAFVGGEQEMKNLDCVPGVGKLLPSLGFGLLMVKSRLADLKALPGLRLRCSPKSKSHSCGNKLKSDAWEKCLPLGP